MTNQTLEAEAGRCPDTDPPPCLTPPASNPPSATDPSPSPGDYPPSKDKEPNAAIGCLFCTGWFIIPIALPFLIAYLDQSPRHHANFSVQSISVVSPFNLSSVSLWTVDFQVEIPTWRCHTYFDGDLMAMLSRGDDDDLHYGAVLNASRRNSGHDHHSVFSVDFATARVEDLNAVFSKAFNLDIKVSGRVRHLLIKDYAGYHNIRCRNLTVGFSRDSIAGTMLGEKKKCESSFSPLVPPLHH